MKRIIKNILLILAIAIFLFFIMISLIIIVLHEPHSIKMMEKEFAQNEEDIIEITEFMVKSKYTNIVVWDTSEKGKWVAYCDDEKLGMVGGEVPIGNKDISEKINLLFKEKHYQNIHKSGNSIVFQRWSNLGNNSGGLVYSIDGNYPKIDFISKYEIFNKANWYYYETDFINEKSS